MGKYYCDYCEKEFKDTSFARKRHLQGLLHQRNRKLWYHSLSLPPGHNQVNLPPHTFGKGLCNRFVNTGFCPYGDSCKYHHPMHNLQGPTIQGTSGFAGSSLLPEGASLQGQVARQSFGMLLGDLPPSLMPPPDGGHPSLPFVDWG